MAGGAKGDGSCAGADCCADADAITVAGGATGSGSGAPGANSGGYQLPSDASHQPGGGDIRSPVPAELEFKCGMPGAGVEPFVMMSTRVSIPKSECRAPRPF